MSHTDVLLQLTWTVSTKWVVNMVLKIIYYDDCSIACQIKSSTSIECVVQDVTISFDDGCFVLISLCGS